MKGTIISFMSLLVLLIILVTCQAFTSDSVTIFALNTVTQNDGEETSSDSLTPAILEKVGNEKKATYRERRRTKVTSRSLTVEDRSRREMIEQANVLQRKFEEEIAAKPIELNRYRSTSDLSNSRKITTCQMNAIIEYFDKFNGTAFTGKGEVFIEAAKESGLDPIYIFAHASVESGFGKSYLAKTKHNYFGIAAYDSNPNAAYSMGNSVKSGIITGAKWIAKNYYNQGQTSLHSMIYGPKRYASSADKWISDINWVMNKAVDVANKFTESQKDVVLIAGS